MGRGTTAKHRLIGANSSDSYAKRVVTNGKNLQGDVVKIYTTNGEVVAEYIK